MKRTCVITPRKINSGRAPIGVTLERRASVLKAMPLTLALIKPEALKKGYAPAIEATIEAQKFSVIARAQVTLTPPQAAELYEEFAGTALFAAMCAAVTSGPLVALALDKADAQAAWSELIGPDDPAVAREEVSADLRHPTQL